MHLLPQLRTRIITASAIFFKIRNFFTISLFGTLLYTKKELRHDIWVIFSTALIAATELGNLKILVFAEEEKHQRGDSKAKRNKDG